MKNMGHNHSSLVTKYELKSNEYVTKSELESNESIYPMFRGRPIKKRKVLELGKCYYWRQNHI